MSDEVFLDASAAAAGGRELHDAGQALGELRQQAFAALFSASAARPWGDDEIGQAFDNGYRPAEQQVIDAWLALADHVRTLGDSVQAAVSDLTGTDQHSAVRVTRAYKEPL